MSGLVWLMVGLWAGVAIGWAVDRLLMRSWLDSELERAQEQLRARDELAGSPAELARRLRDRGDVDGAVVVLTGLGVLAVVLIVQLGIRAGYL